MSEIVLQVEGLSKRYAKGGAPTSSLSYDLLRGVKGLFKRNSAAGGGSGSGSGSGSGEFFYALKDISFALEKGDVLGIIGRNGAGKSTLLKILSEITPPSEGEVRYQGMITSILDVGTGFHPDLSGRENVFLGGAISGMTRKEIRERFDQIVEFSGIGEFIDMPVKHYSSGMFLRLAFSVAFHMPMDILLLDEVLSVGDVDFRARSAAMIKEVARSGTTVVMVSHELPAIRKLCTKCMILEKGELVDFGPTTRIVDDYMETYIREVIRHFGDEDGTNAAHRADHLEHERIAYKGLEIQGVGKSPGDPLYMQDAIELRIRYEKKTEDELFTVVYLHNYEGLVLGDSAVFREDYAWGELPAGDYELRAHIPANLLYAGTFIVELVFGNESQIFLELPYVDRFTVELNPWEAEKAWNRGEQDIPLRPHLGWEMERL